MNQGLIYWQNVVNTEQTDSLQDDGVIKADICERPVHYHHVRVEDLSSQLQQAEHSASMKLYNGTEEREKCEKPYSHIHKALTHLHLFTQFTLASTSPFKVVREELEESIDVESLL